MRTLRDMTPEDWSPSRCRLALFQLWSLCRVRAWLARSKSPPGGGETASLYLAFQPEQNPVEAYTLALLFVAMIWGALAEGLLLAWQPPWACWPVVGIGLLVLSSVVMQLWIILTAWMLRPLQWLGLFANRRVCDAQVTLQFLLMTGLAAARCTAGGWGRWLAVVWLALTGLNAVAALILRVRKSGLAALESQLRRSQLCDRLPPGSNENHFI